jgi:hypothetical protein
MRHLRSLDYQGADIGLETLMLVLWRNILTLKEVKRLELCLG